MLGAAVSGSSTLRADVCSVLTYCIEQFLLEE